MTKIRKSGISTSGTADSCCIFGLLLLLLLSVSTLVESRNLVSSSSSGDYTSEAGTVLSFTATLPARRRSLLDRPASTCGEAAIPKDAEVQEIDTWLFTMADFLGLPRSSCTAMGLQITAGAKSFTVFCLGNTGQLSVFSAGIVAGATLSTGTTTVLHSYDITFDSGSKVTLEANLKTSTAPGLPSAVLECDVLLAVEAAVALPNARRHLLLRVPTTSTEIALVTFAVNKILDGYALLTGIPRDRWTATNAILATDNNGHVIVTFIILFRPTQSQATLVVQNWQNLVKQSSMANPAFTLFGATPVIVPEDEFPELAVGLAVNLFAFITPRFEEFIESLGGGIPDFTGTPSPAPATTTPGSTTTADYYYGSTATPASTTTADGATATPAPTTTTADAATTTPAPITTADDATTTPPPTTTADAATATPAPTTTADAATTTPAPSTTTADAATTTPAPTTTADATTTTPAPTTTTEVTTTPEVTTTSAPAGR